MSPSHVRKVALGLARSLFHLASLRLRTGPPGAQFCILVPGAVKHHDHETRPPASPATSLGRRPAGFPSPRVARTTYSRVPSRWVLSRTLVSQAPGGAKMPAPIVNNIAETQRTPWTLGAHARTDGARPSIVQAKHSIQGAQNPSRSRPSGTPNRFESRLRLARALHAESRHRPLTRNHSQHRDVLSTPCTVHGARPRQPGMGEPETRN